MLEIVRGRSWRQDFTVLDNEDGPMTDLSIYEQIRCQIREKDAIRNKTTGIFENALVQEVTVFVEDSVITLSLTRQQTSALKNRVYQIDVVGTLVDGDEPLLDTEPVAVNNRPTLPASDFIPEPPGTVVPIPDFVQQAEEALED
jgi:hypothetical protein